jgi:hypothetical protein
MVVAMGWSRTSAAERTLGAASASPRRVMLRMLEPPGEHGTRVLVIEDLHRLEEQARQLKLASMGRRGWRRRSRTRSAPCWPRYGMPTGLLGERAARRGRVSAA